MSGEIASMSQGSLKRTLEASELSGPDKSTCSNVTSDSKVPCTDNTRNERNAASTEDFVRKREDYLEWPEYFMAIAFLSAQRSKDPGSQVGACIVNKEKKIVGIGYNGMPNGCSDDELPWRRTADNCLDTKYPYVCHAELNAILNKNSADVKDCTIYDALFPCNECAKLVIQSGIREVVYMSDKYHHKPEFVAARRMFDMAGVKYWQYQPKRKQILIDFGAIDGVSTCNKRQVNGHGDAGTNLASSRSPRQIHGADNTPSGDCVETT